MTEKYKIVRFFWDDDIPARTIKRGLTLEQAQAHCRKPETSWKTAKKKHAYTAKVGPWFDGYTEDSDRGE